MRTFPFHRRISFVLAIALLVFANADSRWLAAQEVTGLQAALAIEKAMVDAIASAEKSVVAIARVRKRPQMGSIPSLRLDANPMLERFRAPLEDPTSPDWVPNEYATGVVIDDAGFVVTNHHVLGDPRENDYYVWVQKRPFTAAEVRRVEQVQASDPWTDLAVLKIEAENLNAITLGNADALQKGQLVIALGNPYAIAKDGDVSASWGIVSNLQRQAPAASPATLGDSSKETLHHYGTLIQTDAKLNLGTSGGALINLRGEMVGLITSFAAMEGYEKSAGFAIPVDETFRRTVETLKKGHVPEFGFLGVAPANLHASLRQQGVFGASVENVVPGTPASRAGLVSGDVITHVNGTQIFDRNVLMRELGKQPVGAKIQLTLVRNTGPGGRNRTILREASLSKKYISSRRPAFSQVGKRSWRGMSIDFATAVPQALTSQANNPLDSDGCVAASDVEPNSPAWRAGFRPGTIITHVDSNRVETPQEFYGTVDRQLGAVKIKLSTGQTLSVESPPAVP